jgi:hypothetical protein
VYVLERGPTLDLVEWGSTEGWLSPNQNSDFGDAVAAFSPSNFVTRSDWQCSSAGASATWA